MRPSWRWPASWRWRRAPALPALPQTSERTRRADRGSRPPRRGGPGHIRGGDRRWTCPLNYGRVPWVGTRFRLARHAIRRRVLSAAPHEVQGQRLPGMETEPLEHSLEVVPYRVRAQPQALGDGRVREPFRREQRDLGLTAPEPEGDSQLLCGRERRQPIQRRDAG